MKKMKKKAYLELCITLIIGFMIGFFVNSIITDKKIKEFSMHQGEWNFWRRTLTEIKATPEQKQAIVPIVKKYTGEAHEIMHKSWEEILPIMEEMETMIMYELTPKQQKQIIKIKDQRNKMRKENMRKNLESREKRNRHEHKEHPNQRPNREYMGEKPPPPGAMPSPRKQ